MTTHSISSTQAKNNFGRILDDVTQNHVRYIIARRGAPQAIMISFNDFASILADEAERLQMTSVLRELRPQYSLGTVLGHQAPPE